MGGPFVLGFWDQRPFVFITMEMADTVRSHPSIFHGNHKRGCSRPSSPVSTLGRCSPQPPAEVSSAFGHLFREELALGQAGRGGPGTGAQGQPPAWPLPLGPEGRPLWPTPLKRGRRGPLSLPLGPGRARGRKDTSCPRTIPRAVTSSRGPIHPSSPFPMQGGPPTAAVSGWSLRRKILRHHAGPKSRACVMT